jgi:4-carboxymuconolactone decarboxylase
MAANMFAKLLTAGVVGAFAGVAMVATAAPEFNTRGNRFKPLAYAELTPDQRAFAEREISSGHGKGAFNIYLRSPETAELSRPFSDYLRFKAPQPRKFKEIAIMLTSRYWGGQYVWYAHRQQALDTGLSPAFIAAMAAGERPTDMSADEATVYDFCTQLLMTPQVSDRNFKAMASLVGDRGIVELVSLMGQYTGLTMLFVVDRYPVPAGAPDEVNKPM